LARRLAAEEKVSPEFVCGDVCDWNADLPEVDIAVCFDIFEHLHDDQLGALLTALRKKFKKSGTLVYHTFPTQYNHIFWGRAWARYPLIPFRHFSPRTFAVLTKAYSLLIDLCLLATRGKTFRKQIKGRGHCNLTRGERLREILQRSGYEIAFRETSNLYPMGYRHPDAFSLQPITHRNLYGVAIPKGM
jgi:2-polyprenyl-3-methyl-5-hydroxy-6-metoxy-1,4-benzoquinol methylase